MSVGATIGSIEQVLVGATSLLGAVNPAVGAAIGVVELLKQGFKAFQTNKPDATETDYIQACFDEGGKVMAAAQVFLLSKGAVLKYGVWYKDGVAILAL